MDQERSAKPRPGKIWWLSGLVCSVVAVTSCESGDLESAEVAVLTPAQEEAAVSRSMQAVKLLSERLSTQLKAALTAGGPENAVMVCLQVAQPLTGATSDELEGLSISRTSLQVRNSDNSPDQVDRKILEAWQELADSDQALPDHEIVPLSGDRALFYKPIITQSLCLSCHGSADEFSPELLELLAQKYPQDQASGYQEGDLRGAFRVVLDLNALASGE